MSSRPRILVLVLAARAWPYPLLTRTIERTWAAAHVPGVHVVSYTGGIRLRRHGNRLELPVSDAYADIGEKTLAAFAYALEHEDFDLLFRTNASSYVDLANLETFAAARARPERFYAGVVAEHAGIVFASGSGYFLSRDLVARVVERRAEWDSSLPDDVAVAQVLAGDGVRPEVAPRVEYRDSREIVDVDTTQYHFRCKTRSGFRIDDVEAMLAIHRAFCNARGRRFPPSLAVARRLIPPTRRLARLLRRRG